MPFTIVKDNSENVWRHTGKVHNPSKKSHSEIASVKADCSIYECIAIILISNHTNINIIISTDFNFPDH